MLLLGILDMNSNGTKDVYISEGEEIEKQEQDVDVAALTSVSLSTVQ